MRDKCIHKSIHDEILRRIREHIYLPSQQLPTDLDFAEEFQSSRLTVARAMNLLVDEKYLERTRGRGTFVCDSLPEMRSDNASALSSVKYISPDFASDTSPVSLGVLRGLHESIRDQSQALVGIELFDSVEKQLELLDHCKQSGGGFAIWPACDERVAAKLNELRNCNVAYVQIDTMVPGTSGDFVGSDNFSGGAMMIDHLVERGYRKIAYLTVPLVRHSVRERAGGVMEALLRHNIKFSSSDFVVIPTPNRVNANDLHEQHMAFLRGWVETAFVQSNQAPDAIFCSCDTIALGMLQLLNEKGISVPNDVALAGYDNIDQSGYASVSLTTVAQDFYGMGKFAGKLLLKSFENRNHPEQKDFAPGHYFLPPKLVIRNSTPSR